MIYRIRYFIMNVFLLQLAKYHVLPVAYAKDYFSKVTVLFGVVLGHWYSSSIECVNISSVPELKSGNHTNASAFCQDHPVLVVPSVTSSAMQIILCKDHSLRYC